MPSGANSLIVGGGIQDVAPFTVGQIPVIVDDDPASVSDSIASQQAGTLDATGIRVAGEVVLGTQALATARVILSSRPGGAGEAFSSLYAIRNSPLLTANLNSSVVIGNNLQAAGRTSNVLIGDNINVGTTGTGRVVAVGEQLTVTTVGQNQFLFGTQIGGGSGIGVVAIGNQITLSGARNQVIAIKALNGLATTTIAHDNVISIGGGSSSAANQLIFGGTSVIHEFAWGKGVSDSDAPSVSAAKLFHTTDAVGSNIPTGSLTIRPGASTGNAAAGGELILGTHLPGAAGGTVQTFQPVITILHNAGGAGVAKIRFDGVTNGAAAAVGTLNNAPAAGDPTFWMPVDIGGVVKYIPCW